jgi:molybdopterin synthase sulfur carrier subunit
MKITILYFALLRDQRGLSTEEVATDATTVAELYQELADLHNFSLPPKMLMAALNEEMCSWKTELAAGDTVAFIPPVAGG